MTDIIEWAARQEIESQIAVLDGTDMASLPADLRIGIVAVGRAARRCLDDPDASGDLAEARDYFMGRLRGSDVPERERLEGCVGAIWDAFRTVRPEPDPDPEPQRRSRRGSASPVRRRTLLRLLADGQWRTWDEVARVFDWTGYGDADRRGPTVKALRRLARDGLLETYPPMGPYDRATDSTIWRMVQ